MNPADERHGHFNFPYSLIPYGLFKDYIWLKILDLSYLLMDSFRQASLQTV